MFNSFLDGSKPASESATIANANELGVPKNEVAFALISITDIPILMKPNSVRRVLKKSSLVAMISNLTEDDRGIAHDIPKGFGIGIEADNVYVRNCFEEYKVIVDTTGHYMKLYKK